MSQFSRARLLPTRYESRLRFSCNTCWLFLHSTDLKMPSGRKLDRGIWNYFERNLTNPKNKSKHDILLTYSGSLPLKLPSKVLHQIYNHWFLCRFYAGLLMLTICMGTWNYFQLVNKLLLYDYRRFLYKIEKYQKYQKNQKKTRYQ